MIQTDYLLDQIKRFMERLGDIRRAQQKGAQAEAGEALEDLLREIEALLAQSAPQQRDQLVPVKAHVHAELGLLIGQTGDAEESLGHMEVARTLLQPLVKGPNAEGKLVEQYGTVLLNAGATHAATGDLNTARARLDEGLSRLESRAAEADGPTPALTSLRIAALQNRAMLSQQAGTTPAARADLERALGLARGELSAEQPHFAALAVDLHHRLTVLNRREGRVEEALTEAKEAVAVARQLVSGDEWSPAAALWVRAKMVLTDLLFASGRFDAGEDHLFELLEAVPELVDPVLNGLDYYLALWKLTDERLEQGGLPRDEVEDSLGELLAQLDTRCPDETLRALVRARYDLVVNGERERAEAMAASQPLPDADPRFLALHTALRRELQE